MNNKDNLKLFFIINPRSGNSSIDWVIVITTYFKLLNHTIELYQLSKESTVSTIVERIISFAPNQVIAVGGDGTVKLAAECLIGKNIPLGILPAGSANGLAKELSISNDPEKALDILIKGFVRKIHVIKINNQLCIHLSDIGLNASAIKQFEAQQRRGMWGYLIASIKVLWKRQIMEVEIQMNKKSIKIIAAVIVIANATKYSSGAIINPIGKLNDALFEVIAVKKISIYEIFKMAFSHAAYNPDKTEIFQTNALFMRSIEKVHFQVDGEYFGMVNEVNVTLIPDALEVIVPALAEDTSMFLSA